jgi:hypothetical protein
VRVQVIINYIIFMRKFLIIVFFGLMSSFGLFFCGIHNFLDNSITEKKMVEALQEALVLGSKTAASNLGDSSCELRECAVGYLGNRLVEIALPDTVKNVLEQINNLTSALNNLSPGTQQTLQILFNNFDTDYSSIFSLGKYGDSIKIALNRGAEKAAPSSINVFREAIFGMGFSDARGILTGSDDKAATSYLHSETYGGLKISFAPIIEEPLKLLHLDNFWEPIAGNYNKFASTYFALITNANYERFFGGTALPMLPYNNLPPDISVHLSTYATGKALDGLFFMVGKQESELRADPWGTVSALGSLISDTVGDLLGDVFSKAKNNAL